MAHCLDLKEVLVGKVTVQRFAKARLPNNHCVLAFVVATVVEAVHHVVHDNLAFAPHEGSDIQLDGSCSLDLMTLLRIVFEEEVNHASQLSILCPSLLSELFPSSPDMP